MRPILIAIIGYVIGIFWELYFKGMALFIFIIGIILLIVLFRKKFSKFNKYLKILIPVKVCIIFMIFIIFAVCYIEVMNYRYENLYKEFEKCKATFVGIIVSEKKEYNYRDAYVVKISYGYTESVKKTLSTKILLKLEKDENSSLTYGDKIIFQGEYKKSEDRTNYRGYSYNEYLKSKMIYGEIQSSYSSINIIEKNNINIIARISNMCKKRIIDNIKQVLPQETTNLALGILIGYTDEMADDLKLSFKDASLSHMLAVSGSHISYIIIGIAFFTDRMKLGKRIAKVVTILVLIFFMFLTGFTSSVTRACIMGIVMMISGIIYRENDFICSISLSALIILIVNPFVIYDAGFKLSFGGTIGIVLFQENIKKLLSARQNKKSNKDKSSILNLKNKKKVIVKNFILESLTVTIAAQIAIIPIIAFDFNTISLTFFISNLLASVFMGIITIGGFILVFISLISMVLARIVGSIYNVPLELLIKIVQVCAKIPGSKVYIITIYEVTIIIYYIVILFWNYFYHISRKENSGIDKLIKKIISYIKNKIIKDKVLIKKIAIIIITIIICIYPIKNKFNKAKFYFVDVGQGDCTVIVTPKGKKIVIDGGGSNTENSSYDVGESVVFPYLLDRRIGSLDYVIISHFDSDHYKGLEYILKSMNVKTVIIPKQFEESSNYIDFIEITKNKKIEVIEVLAGQRILLDKEVEMCVLWPVEDYIKENAINNNSIVFKLYFKNFSAFFTGDIEEEAEKELAKKYENVSYRGENILKSDILKVGHHGSKTSSTQEFIELVKPKIALIGVGRNNNFGHPNSDVIERLKKLRSRGL